MKQFNQGRGLGSLKARNIFIWNEHGWDIMHEIAPWEAGIWEDLPIDYNNTYWIKKYYAE